MDPDNRPDQESTQQSPAATDTHEGVSEPFEPGPASLSGCGKPAVIGCLVLLVLVGVSLVIMVTQSPRLLRWSMGKMQEHVESALPEDLTAEERQRLDDAFGAAAEAMASGQVDPAALGAIQRLSALLPQPGQKLTREQVAEIASLLEGIAGTEAPEAPGAVDVIDPVARVTLAAPVDPVSLRVASLVFAASSAL